MNARSKMTPCRHDVDTLRSLPTDLEEGVSRVAGQKTHLVDVLLAQGPILSLRSLPLLLDKIGLQLEDLWG